MRSLQYISAALLKSARLGALILVGSAHFVSTVAASPILNVAGSTLGCFGSGCTTFGTPAVSRGPYGLTFDGSPFDVTTGAADSTTGFALGTMTRADLKIDTLATIPFTLQVVFTLPMGIGGLPGTSLTALIGATNAGSGGQLDIDFDNAWQTLTFSNASGFGSFEFSVAGDISLNRKKDAEILGEIRNATFTSSTAEQDLAPVPVPEPASLLLFGTGLSAAAYRLRRRRQA